MGRLFLCMTCRNWGERMSELPVTINSDQIQRPTRPLGLLADILHLHSLGGDTLLWHDSEISNTTYAYTGKIFGQFELRLHLCAVYTFTSYNWLFSWLHRVNGTLGYMPRCLYFSSQMCHQLCWQQCHSRPMAAMCEIFFATFLVDGPKGRHGPSGLMVIRY